MAGWKEKVAKKSKFFLKKAGKALDLITGLVYNMPVVCVGMKG